ncbi:MAG: (d)CMP kinase [Clostridiales bacterium]|nr:(d)CMP kinase [Clostridiales bacterium]
MQDREKPFSIAIDGPSGAGKSTMAKMLARELGFLYVDTGALYRTIGYAVLQRGADPSDQAAVEALLPSLTIRLEQQEDGQHVFLNNVDVNDCIRTPEVSMAASRVSALPAVRQFLLDIQRNTAKSVSIIMDGRDIGTVVLPDASLKVFLTASAEIRAQRRYQELIEKGAAVTYEEVLRDMRQRDYQDSHRELAPLKEAEDAVRVDSSAMTLEEAVEAVRRLMDSRRSRSDAVRKA